MSIGSQPRFRFAALPTPLQEARRLRDELGGPGRCPRILIKRDDLTGLGLGGNKVRKLEFLVADALREQATVLVTSGAVQSNHARLTAAAGCVAGLRTAVVLTSPDEYPVPRGNLLLDYLLGAEVHFVPPSADKAIATGIDGPEIDRVVAELRASGERPYVIPIGGSSPIGALGYVAGTLELVGQLADLGESPSWLYYSSGSRSTQAGLELGARMYSAPYRPRGIAVSGGEPEKVERAVRIGNAAATLLGVTARLRPEELLTEQSYFGEGYGIPTDGGREAITLLARTEGIFFDPVYTAKGLSGMIDHIRRGIIGPDETIVFLHTGGVPALFAT